MLTIKMKNLLILVIAMLPMFSSSCQAQKVDNSTIKSMDVRKYLGQWFEIARFDHSFERGVYFPKAEYSMNADGTIKVTNSGIKNGKTHISIGKAKLTDTVGLFRVSFFGPFYSDYRVMMLSDDYQYALVGSKSKKYLWILSRSITIPNDIRKQILDEAGRRGYAVEDLMWMDQTKEFKAITSAMDNLNLWGNLAYLTQSR